MNKKGLTIILCLVLLIAFFLPYLGNYSGFDMIFGKYKIMSGGGLASILIPLGGLLLLFGAITDNNFTTMGIIFWMPLAGIAVIIIMLLTKDVSIGDIVNSFRYGFWLTLVAAVLLPLSKGRG